MTPMKFTPPLKSIESVHEMFQWIVQDEFFSPTYNTVIVVDDSGYILDNESKRVLQYPLTYAIETLYQEWHTATFGDSSQ
jgi:3-hydroxyisobutyrate dehydrogenase-like beta-hydroxyacid dehydrogenase